MLAGNMIQEHLAETLKEDKVLFDKLLKFLLRENEELVRDILDGLMVNDPGNPLITPISHGIDAFDAKKTR